MNCTACMCLVIVDVNLSILCVCMYSYCYPQSHLVVVHLLIPLYYLLLPRSGFVGTGLVGYWFNQLCFLNWLYRLFGAYLFEGSRLTYYLI